MTEVLHGRRSGPVLRLIPPLLAIIALPAACVDAPAPGASATRDSSGVRIVENAAPAWGPGDGWTVDPEPTIVIGSHDGAPEYHLFGVTAGTQLPDGRIAIADGSQQVRVYGSDGSFILAIGRRGNGPGEFRGIGAIRISGDTLLVHDPPRDVERFSFDGEYLGGKYELPPGLLTALGEGFSNFSTEPLWDGSWLLAGLPRRTESVPLWEVHRPPAAFLRYDPATGLDTLAVLPFVEQFYLYHDGQKSVGRPLFPDISHEFIAWAPRRILFGDPAPPEIRVFRPDSPWVRIRWAPPGREITDADIVWERDRLDAVARDRPTQAAEAIFRALWIRPLARLPRPEVAPAFIDLQADAAGNAWVKEYLRRHHTSDRWRVFDPTGRELGLVELESGLRPLEIGPDYLLALHHDDLDIERVRLHALRKPD